jgi:hypothetical protein
MKMPKIQSSYLLQDDLINNPEDIKAGQIEMLKNAIEELERGDLREFILVKHIQNKGGRFTLVARATSPVGWMHLMADFICDKIKGQGQ